MCQLGRMMTGFEEQLIESLDRLIPTYLRALRTALAEGVGVDRLTMQQLRCLQAIASAGEDAMTTTKLAELMSVSVPTMSSMLDGMSVRGLVERRPLPGDRRRVPLVVTGQGEAILGYYQSIMDDRHREIIRGLGNEERILLQEASSILLRRLSEVEASASKEDLGAGKSRLTAATVLPPQEQ